MHDPYHDFNHGLIQAERNAVTLDDEYRAGRDRLHVIPYTPPESMEMEPYRSTSDELTRTIIQVGKPIIALSVVGGTIAIIGATVVGVIGSGLAFIGANATVIGGGVFAVVVVVLGLFGGRGDSEGREHGSPTTSPQNIHVTVNVAGGSVTTNLK